MLKIVDTKLVPTMRYQPANNRIHVHEQLKHRLCDSVTLELEVSKFERMLFWRQNRVVATVF